MIFQKEIFSRFLPSMYIGHVALAAVTLCDACQPGKMATLMNSLFFVFKISHLRNYCVQYYDYIVKWCSEIACNWCASLDICLILVLRVDRDYGALDIGA